MSRTGCPYDNAMVESFMKTLKHEEVDGRIYRDLDHVRTKGADFLETVYNRKRLHSALGYKPPADFEAEYSPPVGAAAQQPQPALNTHCP
jgi:transposase InsO family protein